MRRYRRDDEILEIELEGKTVLMRSGPADGDLREEIRRFGDERLAQWEADKLGAQRLADGFELVQRTDSGPELSSRPFVEAVRKDPDDVDNYLVYGDWLQSRGDPRGELITVQHALGDPTLGDLHRRELRRQEAALLARHRRRLWGVLGEQVIDVDTQVWAADLFEIEWHMGFVRSAALVLDRDLEQVDFARLMADFSPSR